VCDEYQAFATSGENEPSGDEKFFSLRASAVHPDRRDAEHQLAPIHAAGRVVADAAARAQNEDLPRAL
jgi:hypothetical protein